MRYLLQNALVFDVHEGCLNAISSGKKVKLPYPAALLLEVFCQNAQQLIARETLLDKAWNDNGFQGSSSNLYNSLSAIRKAISSLGIVQQAIRTQPKVGFILELSVESLEPAQEASPAGSNQAKQDKTVPETVPSLPATTACKALQNDNPPADIDNNYRLINNIKSTWLTSTENYLLWPLFVIIISVALYSGISTADNGSGIQPLNYDLIATSQHCSLFRLEPLTNIYPSIPPDKKIEKLAEKYGVDCNMHKINFYVHTAGVVHAHNNFFNVLLVMCIYNKYGDTVMNCFNDNSVYVTQNDDKKQI